MCVFGHGSRCDGWLPSGMQPLCEAGSCVQEGRGTVGEECKGMLFYYVLWHVALVQRFLFIED